MNTGQMLLVIGALALLSTLTLAVNSTILNKYEIIFESEATVDAISVGQALLDEALAKRFDKADTGTVKIYSASTMTLSYNLGPESPEKIWTSASPDSTYQSILGYNDFDDYNGYARAAYTPRMGRFVLTSTVYYVTNDNPDQLSDVQTFQKKISVQISHPNLKVPVVVSDISIYRRYF